MLTKKEAEELMKSVTGAYHSGGIEYSTYSLFKKIN